MKIISFIVYCHLWKYLIILQPVDSVVTGGRGYMNINNNPGWWVGDEDFKMIMKYSYPFSTCCNFFVNGTTEGIEIMFNQFINLYPFDYTIGMILYECKGYFMLASAEEILIQALKWVPTAISTTEILIMVDGPVSDNSSLLNISLFKNSNVNIVSRSGSWSLSENFLLPRKFKRVYRPSEMVHKTGIVNLEGRQLIVGTFYRPPFSYLSTSINKTVNGVQGQYYLANNGEMDGIEVKLFLIMAEQLNFTWIMRKPDEPPGYYGFPTRVGWKGGLTGLVFKKEVDLAFGEIFLEKTQNDFVNLSTPWWQVLGTFLVPRPKPIVNMWALLEPFSLSLWFAVVVITILMSIALWKQAWIDPRVPKRFKSYINAITELMGRLVGSWAPRKIKGLRVQLQLWHFAGLLLVTAYSSSLAAILTTPDYEPRIDTAKNFIESNLTWGSYGAPRNLKFFFDMNDTYAKQIPRKLRYEANEQERGRNILSKNYAIYGRIGHKIFFPVAPVNGRDLNNYRLMREPTSKFFLSFITQPWLVNSIDTMVSRLIESGFAEYHIRDIIRRRFTTDFRSVFIEHDVENKDKPQPLELKPLGVAFIVLFIGYFVATAVFLFEVRARKNEKAVAKGKVNIQRRINQRVRKLQLKYFIRRCIFQR